MSKRSRSPSRPAHRRPGTRPPTTRPARERATAEPSQLEAAAVVAEDMVEERLAEPGREVERAARASHVRRVKPGSALAAKAATEYVYVAQDLRRIFFVAALLVGLMIALWLLIVVLRVIPLPFY